MSFDANIATLQTWLDENSIRYKQIKQGLEDSTRLRAMITEQLPVAVLPILEYNPVEHSSDVAVAACVETRVRLESLLQNIHFVDLYEEKREQLDNFLKMEDTRNRRPDPNSLDPEGDRL